MHWAQVVFGCAVENAEIGYYDLASRSYVFKKEAGPFEVVSLNGNVAELDESPLVHAHAAFSRCDESLATIGGHLKSAQVALTLEVWLSRVSQPLLRAPDPETGLNLITL